MLIGMNSPLLYFLFSLQTHVLEHAAPSSSWFHSVDPSSAGSIWTRPQFTDLQIQENTAPSQSLRHFFPPTNQVFQLRVSPGRPLGKSLNLSVSYVLLLQTPCLSADTDKDSGLNHQGLFAASEQLYTCLVSYRLGLCFKINYEKQVHSNGFFLFKPNALGWQTVFIHYSLHAISHPRKLYSFTIRCAESN